MKKLQHLLQDTKGNLYEADTIVLAGGEITRVLRAGMPKTIVVKNPCSDISVLSLMKWQSEILI